MQELTVAHSRLRSSVVALAIVKAVLSGYGLKGLWLAECATHQWMTEVYSNSDLLSYSSLGLVVPHNEYHVQLVRRTIQMD